jgi:crossover junction endodeoxyribonuclease RuvC
MSATNNQETILGIDPGFGRIGFGVISQVSRNAWSCVDYGCIETSAKLSFADRLLEIDRHISGLIKKYKPTRIAVEKLFFFRNVTTAIDVGHARGIILLSAAKSKLSIDEFTPLQIKQAITGYGKAEKPQMQKMVAVILNIKEKIKSDDAADALAVALCAGQSLWIKKICK